MEGITGKTHHGESTKKSNLNTEIERKFLVKNNLFKEQATKAFIIAQGYLSTDPERTVRVRIKGKEGYLTIKGKSNTSGTTRFEWEHSITKADAHALLQLCEKGVIQKTRHEITVGKHVFEVDVFEDDNEGLIIAEVELEGENEVFEKPSWLGKEVTGQLKYYNSQLAKKPYKRW